MLANGFFRHPIREGKMRSLSLVAISLSFLLSSSALARPCTNADFEGKKFCYDVGQIETYGPAGHPGKATNDHWGDFTWEITEKRLVSAFPSLVDKTFLGDCETPGDGTFTYSGQAPGLDHWSGNFHYWTEADGKCDVQK
jgi:hypothetical protein